MMWQRQSQDSSVNSLRYFSLFTQRNAFSASLYSPTEAQVRP